MSHVKKRQLGKATEEKYTKSLYGFKKFARFCANALKTMCKQLFFKCVFTLETKVIIAVRCMFVYPDTKNETTNVQKRHKPSVCRQSYAPNAPFVR